MKLGRFTVVTVVLSALTVALVSVNVGRDFKADGSIAPVSYTHLLEQRLYFHGELQWRNVVGELAALIDAHTERRLSAINLLLLLQKEYCPAPITSRSC